MQSYIVFRSLANAQPAAERPTIPAPKPAAPPVATVLANRLNRLANDVRTGRLAPSAAAATLAILAGLVAS
jgi:hypothetical protein